MQLSNNQQAFLALVRAGLWGKEEVQLTSFGQIDFNEVMTLAEAQSVIGLVTSGIEHVTDLKVSQSILLQFVGRTIQIENRNKAMNGFIADMIDKMRKSDIYTLLVKGQGIAQCYERPLWRASGDVDLLLNDTNYAKAKKYLIALCSGNKPEERYSKHLGMNIDHWYVEIHGTLRTGLSSKIDKEVDDVQKDVFYCGNVRSWDNGGVQVFLPAPDNDVFFVFTHFIKHFYKEGMNLRQVFDWCRLLWTYNDKLNLSLLEKRLHRAGLVKEWKTFASLAVDYFGMPVEAMPFYDSKYKKNGNQLIKHILKSETYNAVRDTWAIMKIFPRNTLRFLPSIFMNVNGLKIKERVWSNGNK